MAVAAWLALVSFPTYLFLSRPPAADAAGYTCNRSVLATALHPSPDPVRSRSNPDGLFDATAACNRDAHNDLRKALLIDDVPLLVLLCGGAVAAIVVVRQQRPRVRLPAWPNHQGGGAEA